MVEKISALDIVLEEIKKELERYNKMYSKNKVGEFCKSGYALERFSDILRKMIIRKKNIKKTINFLKEIQGYENHIIRKLIEDLYKKY